MKPIVLILLSILLGTLGQIAIKWGTLSVSATDEGFKELIFKYFTNISILFGLALYALSAFIWIFAVAKVELSFAYPMVALGYVLVALFSYFLFKEDITGTRIIGLLTVVSGVVLISRS